MNGIQGGGKRKEGNRREQDEGEREGEGGEGVKRNEEGKGATGREKEKEEVSKGKLNISDLNGEGKKGLRERMVAPDQREGREKEER